MHLSFKIGKKEEHCIDYHFNQFWGTTKISVDGKRIKSDMTMFSYSLTRVFDLIAGNSPEALNVSIHRHRKLLFAGFRKQKHQVFVNGELVLEREGY